MGKAEVSRIALMMTKRWNAMLLQVRYGRVEDPVCREKNCN